METDQIRRYIAKFPSLHTLETNLVTTYFRNKFGYVLETYCLTTHTLETYCLTKGTLVSTSRVENMQTSRQFFNSNLKR